MPATATPLNQQKKIQKRRSARVLQHDPVLFPGFGTAKDLHKLATELSEGQPTALPVQAVEAIMRSRGRGAKAEEAAASAPVSNAWADFMKEEGVSTPGASAETPKQEETGRGKRRASSRKKNANDNDDDDDDTKPSAAATSATTERVYQTITSSSSKKKKSKPSAGFLVQSGTLDAAAVGRSKLQLASATYHLQVPTVLKLPTKIARVFTSANAVHSIAVDTAGQAYGWGRNEQSQLGLPVEDWRNVAYPTALEELPGKVAQAALGKNHTLFLLQDNTLWAVGANKSGQCGVRNFTDIVPHYRKCIWDEDSHDEIQQIACGEDFSVVLDSAGVVHSTGSSEFGQLGNGETGEYFVTASKLAFANCNVLTARTIYCHAPQEKLHVNSEQATVVPLKDSSSIRISHIACGKHHTLAVEAASDQSRRVFSWGCGNYGVLGHGVQADEYFPRMIGILNVLLPQGQDSELTVHAGAHCSLLRCVSNGHVFYWGKHRSVGEATMRPTLVDVLAHNGHDVTQCAAGGQSVVCSTVLGQTVAWGQGPHGELGLEKAKSSAKPTFVEKLDGCIVTDLACGYGHTLFVVPDAKKLGDPMTEDDVQDLVEKNEKEPQKTKGGKKRG